MQNNINKRPLIATDKGMKGDLYFIDSQSVCHLIFEIAYLRAGPAPPSLLDF